MESVGLPVYCVAPPPCEPSCFAKDSCTSRRPFFILDRSAFVCDHGEEGPGISQAICKSGAHKYKPKSQVLLPAGITCHHGISYDQRGQRGKLLPQTPPVAGGKEALVSSPAAFIVLCPPCRQRGWGSLPTWPGLFSFP